MSTQIAVRLPEEMVEFLDDQVAAGRAPSRAAIVTDALERQMRRMHAERDAETLRGAGLEDDLDPLVEWSAGNFEIDG